MNATLAKILSDRSFITNLIQLGTLVCTQVFHANVGTTVTVMGALQAVFLSMDAAIVKTASDAGVPIPGTGNSGIAPPAPTPVMMVTPVVPATPTPEKIAAEMADANNPKGPTP